MPFASDAASASIRSTRRGGDDDGRAECTEHLRGARADTRARAGDDRDLSVEPELCERIDISRHGRKLPGAGERSRVHLGGVPCRVERAGDHVIVSEIELPYFLARRAADPPWPGVVVIHEGNGRGAQLLRG